MFNLWDVFSWESAVFKENHVLVWLILPIFFLEGVYTKNV